MNRPDSVEERLRAVRWPPSPTPIENVVARGRRRRLRRYVGASVACALFIAGTVAVVGPFVAGTLADHPAPTVSPVAPEPTVVPVSGATAAAPGPTREMPVGLGATIQAPTNWSLLLDPNEAGFPVTADLLQLTNFDPALFRQRGTVSDAERAWRCPLVDGAVPSDGVLLNVRMTSEGKAAPKTPIWPVHLAPGSDECGSGLIASWRVGDRGFAAFASMGPDASAADRQTLERAFASMRFGQEPDWFLVPDSGTITPQQVLFGQVDADAIWLQTVYPEAVDAPSDWCQGVIRLRSRDVLIQYRDSPFTAWEDTDCMNVGYMGDTDPFATFSFGGVCGSAMSIEGFIRSDVQRAFIRLDDGTEVPLSIKSPPPGLDTAGRNLLGGVVYGGLGVLIGVLPDGSEVQGRAMRC